MTISAFLYCLQRPENNVVAGIWAVSKAPVPTGAGRPRASWRPCNLVGYRSGAEHQPHKLHWILPEKVTFPELDRRHTLGGYMCPRLTTCNCLRKHP